ncbi:MAG: hypothetical protein JWO51_3827 [Rhodospirillales bacterium]|nr:hypothetical protein [Rhodospirillales bacterium]
MNQFSIVIPAKAGFQGKRNDLSDVIRHQPWIPAFAGMTGLKP